MQKLLCFWNTALLSFCVCFFFFLTSLQAATGLPALLTLLILLPFFQRAVRRIPLVVGRTELPLLKRKQQLLNFKPSGEGPMLGKY